MIDSLLVEGDSLLVEGCQQITQRNKEFFKTPD